MVTARDIAEVERINIVPYVEKYGAFKNLSYEDIDENSHASKTTDGDIL